MQTDVHLLCRAPVADWPKQASTEASVRRRLLSALEQINQRIGVPRAIVAPTIDEQ